ncbi:exo-alpha-sialidase [Photobacterium kishitanii]|uniref:exo-alpha-sialidase n=1 Tax=Photobacterium kishitanii TaxID=318456 RepID=UPI000430D1AE|nr:exo-alpha-sialidase [Photobacterium kishitanii]CEO40974.1 Sialidase [Photobacterium kishitanii]
MTFKKTYLLTLIASLLSCSASAQVMEFIPSANPIHDEPIEQGWVNYLSGHGYGQSIANEDLIEWYVNGNNGRANWKITPDTTLNNQAQIYGWQLTTQMRVASGGYITNYYSNGSKRFLPIISINQNNELTVTFDGETAETVLAADSTVNDYHRYDIVFHPGDTQTASFYFDGRLIRDQWVGTASNQNMIAWGNGSSSIAGEAYYKSIAFQVNGDAVFSSPDRIPSLVVSDKTPGTVVIFAEKRVGGGDPGAISNTNDIITRTSQDYGRTWSNELNLTEEINISDDFDFSDPRPIYLADENKVLVSYVRWPTNAAQNGDRIKPWMPSGVFYNVYDVANNTWEQPVNVTSDVKERTLQIIGWGGHEYYTRSSQITATDSWDFSTQLSIYSGTKNELFISNGSHEFRVNYTHDNQGRLIAHLNGQENPIIIKNKGDHVGGIFTSSIQYSPADQSARLLINDVQLAQWTGMPSADSIIGFGQTDAEQEGRLHIKSLSLAKNTAEIINYDASALAMLNPSESPNSPESQGWQKSHSGKAYNFYGVASINPGPGHGIELTKQTQIQGNHNQRLIYPAITLDKYFLNVVSAFSDDKGQTWTTGSALPIPYRWNNNLETLEPSEADIVELNNGDLLLTARLDFNKVVNGINYGPRHQFISSDGGETWTMPEGNDSSLFNNISTSTVDASITRFTPATGESYLLFTNPMGSPAGSSGRSDLGLWFSFDEGTSWQGPIQLVNGSSAYSDIYQLDDNNAMVIVEDNGPKIRVLTIPVTLIKQTL